ncbi:MAG: DUF2769 domain-containing protein [archaeon]
MIEFNELLKDKCICKNCPTYTEQVETIAHCYPDIGKTKHVKEDNGCMCKSCPVYQKTRLKNHYYCLKGHEEQQNKKA